VKYMIVLIVLLTHCSYTRAIQWTTPSDTSTSFVFSPGIMSNERQIAKYCRNYAASTGEKVTCRNDFETISGTRCSSCNFAEITLNPVETGPKKKKPWYASLHPSHIAGSIYWKIRNKFIDPLEKIDIALLPENQAWVEGKPHNGLTLRKHTINFNALNIGQTADITILSGYYDRHVQAFPDSDVVMYGVSRGSATTFLFLATEYESKSIKHIKAAVLEGCFDAVKHVVKQRFPTLCKSDFIHSSLHTMLTSIFRSYQPNGLSPLSKVNELVHICNTHDIPLLFITSRADSIVRFGCTQNLCTALKQAGIRNAYLLVLEKSDHPFYMLDNETDKRTYEAVVHAFYKKYNLSHDTALAQKGELLLERCKI
jgi:hypothetical protein